MTKASTRNVVIRQRRPPATIEELSAALKSLRVSRLARVPHLFGASLEDELERLGQERLVRRARARLKPHSAKGFDEVRWHQAKGRWCVVRSAPDLICDKAIATRVGKAAYPEVHPAVYGVPGRGIHEAVRQICENVRPYEWALRMDIQNFYGLVRHAAVIDSLREVVPERLRQTVLQLLRAAERPSLQGRGLGTGTPLAAVLGNLVLAGLDGLFPTEVGGGPYAYLTIPPAMRRQAQPLASVPLAYFRYQDDALVLFQGDRELGWIVQDLVASVIRPLGLGLNEKTALTAVGDEFAFLGVKFSEYGSRLAALVPDTPGKSVRVSGHAMLGAPPWFEVLAPDRATPQTN